MNLTEVLSHQILMDSLGQLYHDLLCKATGVTPVVRVVYVNYIIILCCSGACCICQLYYHTITQHYLLFGEETHGSFLSADSHAKEPCGLPCIQKEHTDRSTGISLTLSCLLSRLFASSSVTIAIPHPLCFLRSQAITVQPLQLAVALYSSSYVFSSLGQLV